MTTAHDIDLPAVLAERLTTCHPDVLRELLAAFIHALGLVDFPAVADRPRPLRGSVWSPPTLTLVWWPRSVPPCLGRPGNGVVPTTRPT